VGRSLLDDMTEAEFQSLVISSARKTGWDYWHISDARRVVEGKLVGDVHAAGLPDLILVHPSRGFVFAELKRQRDARFRPAQRRTLNKMAVAAGVAAMSGCSSPCSTRSRSSPLRSETSAYSTTPAALPVPNPVYTSPQSRRSA
jgi:hypothetical protein